MGEAQICPLSLDSFWCHEWLALGKCPHLTFFPLAKKELRQRSPAEPMGIFQPFQKGSKGSSASTIYHELAICVDRAHFVGGVWKSTASLSVPPIRWEGVR